MKYKVIANYKNGNIVNYLYEDFEGAKETTRQRIKRHMTSNNNIIDCKILELPKDLKIHSKQSADFINYQG